jgi:hypothetical protein
MEQNQLIIDSLPKYRFKPIINLNREQIVHYMSKAKLYIDFGIHPGMERIPREAAASGCAVITNKCGSAKFAEDVQVPEKYKFENFDLPVIKDTIEYILNNFSRVFDEFSGYRNIINGQEKQMEEQINFWFGLKNEHKKTPPGGLEPPTDRLTADCSTTEL